MEKKLTEDQRKFKTILEGIVGYNFIITIIAMIVSVFFSLLWTVKIFIVGFLIFLLCLIIYLANDFHKVKE